MTVDPTALQAARLAIGQIRACWPHLDDHRDTTMTRQVRGRPVLTARARAERDDLARAERADRDSVQTYRALAPSPAPANLQLVDAEQATRNAITTTYWAIRNDLRQWSSSIARWPALVIAAQLTWLTGMLANTSTAVVDQAAKDLPTAARQLAGAVGVRLDDDWHAIGRRCPSCGLRALYTWRQSPVAAERTTECRGEPVDPHSERATPCRCTGDGCPCARPGARTGSRHLWPAT